MGETVRLLCPAEQETEERSPRGAWAEGMSPHTQKSDPQKGVGWISPRDRRKSLVRSGIKVEKQQRLKLGMLPQESWNEGKVSGCESLWTALRVPAGVLILLMQQASIHTEQLSLGQCHLHPLKTPRNRSQPTARSDPPAENPSTPQSSHSLQNLTDLFPPPHGAIPSDKHAALPMQHVLLRGHELFCKTGLYRGESLTVPSVSHAGELPVCSQEEQPGQRKMTAKRQPCNMSIGETFHQAPPLQPLKQPKVEGVRTRSSPTPQRRTSEALCRNCQGTAVSILLLQSQN